MGKVKDCCIVFGGRWRVEETVRAKLAEGWEPIGSAQMFKEYDKKNWWQSMVLREVDDEEGSD